MRKPFRFGLAIGVGLVALAVAGLVRADSVPETNVGAEQVSVRYHTPAGAQNAEGSTSDAGFRQTVTAQVTGTVGLALPDAGLLVQGSVNSTTMVGGTAASATNPSPQHESGYALTKNTCKCVLCAPAGDGGTIPLTTGTRYVEKVIDQNGSPVQVAEGAACGSFGGVGEMKMAGSTMDLTPTLTPDAGTGTGLATYQSCCAQTATTTAGSSGPWYCVCPAR